MPYLMHMNEKGIATEGWELGRKTMVFGRGEDVDVRIDDETMSRRHFAIEFKDKGHEVTDLESGNGTRLNNVKVQNKALAAGDVIQAGQSLFRYDVGMSTMINQAEDKSGRTIRSQLKDLYSQFE